MSQKLDEEFEKELDEQIDFLNKFDKYKKDHLIELEQKLQQEIGESRKLLKLHKTIKHKPIYQIIESLLKVFAYQTETLHSFLVKIFDLNGPLKNLEEVLSKLKSKIWQKDIDNLNNRYKQLEEKCVNEYISETYKKKLKKKIDDIKLEGSKETIKAIEQHFPGDEIKIPYQDLLSKAHTIIENLSGCGNIKLKIEEDKIENLAKKKMIQYLIF
jgi:hypothetical protein